MKKVTIRLSDELHELLAALAKANQRSINKQVIWIVEQAAEARKSQDTAQGAPDKTKGSAV